MATRDVRVAPIVQSASSLLSTRWYWNYVLGLLTLCYVANVLDRSTVLATSIQSIKREFGASDFQLGMLSGLPFAVFYSILGIQIGRASCRERVYVLV